MLRTLFTTLLLLIIVSSKAQVPKIENNQLVLDNPVSFKPGTSELTEEGKKTLQQVKDFMVAKDYVSLLRVEGHSDNTGTETDNQKLTEQRALTICLWLADNGVECARVLPVGFGSTKPLEDNSTAEGKAKNRRIVFAIASLRGKMIGGLPADGGGTIAGNVCK